MPDTVFVVTLSDYFTFLVFGAVLLAIPVLWLGDVLQAKWSRWRRRKK